MAVETRTLDEKEGGKSKKPYASGQGSGHMQKCWSRSLRKETLKSSGGIGVSPAQALCSIMFFLKVICYQEQVKILEI